jgi:hypothetical protein
MIVLIRVEMDRALIRVPIARPRVGVRVHDRVLGGDEGNAVAVAGFEEEGVVAEAAVPDRVDGALDRGCVGGEGAQRSSGLHDDRRRLLVREVVQRDHLEVIPVCEPGEPRIALTRAEPRPSRTKTGREVQGVVRPVAVHSGRLPARCRRRREM